MHTIIVAGNKFYEAVDLLSSEEYAGEYLTWMSEQMNIKKEQKPLDYFERMLPSSYLRWRGDLSHLEYSFNKVDNLIPSYKN